MLQVPDEAAGRPIKCSRCDEVFQYPATKPPPSEAESPASTAAGSPFHPDAELPAVNPYATPSAELIPDEEGVSALVSSTARMALKQTRPWVLLLSILGFVFSGLMLLGGLAMLLVSIFGGEWIMVAGAALYVVLGSTYFFGAWIMFRYGQRIGSFLATGGLGDFEQALLAQKSIWKFFGIITLAVIAIYFLAVVVFMGIGVMMAAWR